MMNTEIPQARFRTQRGRPTNESVRTVVLACIRELANTDGWAKECYGRKWARVTREALRTMMPELTDRQVHYATKILVDRGKLIKGKHNSSPFDQTLWYAINEEE